MECHLSVRHGGAVAVLNLRGEIDVETASRLEDCLALILRARVEQIVVDFADVRFIDSSGLYVLVRAARLARGTTRILVANAHEHVDRVLTVSGVEQLVDLDPAATAASDVRPVVELPS